MSHSLSDFDINGPGLPGNIFGLPFTQESAQLVLLPIPWEATVSYHSGTAAGPEAILAASRQVDFFMREIPDAWKLGVSMTSIPHEVKATSDKLRILVEQFHASGSTDPLVPQKVNEDGENLNIYVKRQVSDMLTAGKLVGLVGGDHSTPLGFIRALSERNDKFAILQIDAHADLRKSYEGFVYSHASIMYNALKIPSVTKLVQVGIRDLCDAEYEVIRRGAGRIQTFFDEDIKSRMNAGTTWETICTDIVKELPQKVYISFDIDGLDPRYCPHTGTPVPGGLEYHHAVDLIKAIAISGRTIIGFDLNEVAPGKDNDWDSNVGARLLWQLCCWMGVSNNRLTYSAI